MKKLIKYVIILFILFIPIWFIFDNTIIKSIIIKTSEKATKKETYLKKVNISYVPNLTLELIDFKLPNPIQNNYLIKAKELKIEINTNALFKKSLIIESITSNQAILFDSSEPPHQIIQPKKPSKQTEKTSTITQLIKTSLSKSLKMFNESEIKENQKEAFNFNQETQEIDEIIENSSLLINEKKENILNNTNTTLYEINSIKIDNINNMNQLTETKKNLDRINEKYKEISNDIKTVETIYLQSEEKINEISNSISEKMSTAFTFEIIGSEQAPSSSILTEPSKKVIGFFIDKFNQKKQNQAPEKIIGKTYIFNTKKQPKFLIKKIEINTFEDKHYLKGLNITLSKIISDELKIYIKLTDHPTFEKFIVNISSIDKNTFIINSRFRNIKLQQTRLHENKDIIVNFLENKLTNIDISGTIAASSNIDIKAIIKEPAYRVINKQTTNHLLSEFIPYLNNQDLDFSININGTMENYSVNANTNLDPLIKNLQSSILNKKISQLKKEQEKKIEKIKTLELKKTNAKKTAFNESSTKTINQLGFQSDEILNQKKIIERQVNQKKLRLENKVKNEAENAIKNITY